MNKIEAKVCQLKQEGFTHREISEKVYGKRTAASSVWYILNKFLYNRAEEAQPNIILFDIETAPELAYTWGRFKQFVAPTQVVRRSYMLSYAYKRLGSDEVFADALPFYDDYAEFPEDDYKVVKSLWDVLDGADIVIAHNGINFDLAYANARFAYHGLGVPSPFKVVDTLRVAKKYFRFPANSLAELCAFFGVGTKLKTDFDLWVGCMGGDEESWKYMVDYNKQDINSLEDVYLKMRPYDKSHPNIGLYHDDEFIRCPITGSTDVVKLPGNAYTAMSGFETYRGPLGNVFRTNKRVKKVNATHAQ